jgi:hypothetical protein
MIPAQDIVDRVTDLLLDKDREVDAARWSDAELIRWMNDSRMAIITRKPQAGAVIQSVALVAGSLQTMPEDGVSFLDAIRNMGANGLTPGRSIRRTDRQNLDDDDMYWHASTASSEISQFTFDDRIDNRYYVYPPAVAGTQIEISYSKIPAAITSLDDSIGFPLEYIDAVVNYICYRAKSKDSEYVNAAEAGAYYAAFNDALGNNQTDKISASPNQPGNSV